MLGVGVGGFLFHPVLLLGLLAQLLLAQRPPHALRRGVDERRGHPELPQQLAFGGCFWTYTCASKKRFGKEKRLRRGHVQVRVSSKKASDRPGRSRRRAPSSAAARRRRGSGPRPPRRRPASRRAPVNPTCLLLYDYIVLCDTI